MKTMASKVVYCENCERWFCLDCDEEGGPCVHCGRMHCGECRSQGVVCCPKDDE